MQKNYFFTSESVSAGHPDKLCDQVSDHLLDAFLKRDAYARVAVECFATTDKLVIGGEINSKDPLSKKEIEQVARDTIKKIGYASEGFDWRTVEIEILLHQQSPDIAVGVDEAADKEEGAGDQGIMFGYACNETDVLMPAAIQYAHRILHNIAEAVAKGDIALGPDAKSQVTLEYKNGKPVRADSVLVSIQHPVGMTQEQVRSTIKPYIEAALPEGWMCADAKLYVNPTGIFTIGGPVGDAGLTGRKIIVDTYGGAVAHGGGAFSGKDPTKVDRSAAYAARYLAKNVVASGVADKCLIQLSYAIGVAKPLSFFIDTYGTNKVDEEDLADLLQKLIDLSPKGIREHLQLNKPIYAVTAAYGHFGRAADSDGEGTFPWEKTDLAEKIKETLLLKNSA